MDLTTEQSMLVETIRDFAEREIRPVAAAIDAKNKFPEEIIWKLGELGMMGIPFPDKYGGGGMDNVSYIMAVEELSRVSGTVGEIVAAHISLAASAVFLFGLENQKHVYLRRLCRGELGAFAMTEPQAGSDATAIQTTAKLDGGEWVINGGKIFITGAGYAKIIIITAVTGKKDGKNQISTFIIDTDTQGFSVGKTEDLMGIRGAAVAAINFDNCRIPKENLLGAEGAGLKQFLTILNGGRISMGAFALGIAQGAYEEAVKYSQERIQFNKPIAHFQAVQFMIADMTTEIAAARLLIYHTARLKDMGKPYLREGSMAKLFATEIAQKITYNAVQIHGGYGFTKDYPVERMFRDARLSTIGDGTSEIQRIIIARDILKSD